MFKTLSRFLFGTLRGRLIIGVAIVHAVMMTLFISDLTLRQRTMLLDRQIEEATALSEALATSAAGWISSDDISGLQELVDAQRRYPEILFVILADEEGRVLADTDKSRLGQYLLDLPHEARQTVLSRTPVMVDVAVPAMIGERYVGWARIGIGQKAVGKKLAEIIRSGVFYALAAILIGSVIAWFMGSRITRRLYVVQGTIDAVRSGNRSARSSITGVDEPAVMAHEFNSMLDMLVEQDTKLHVSEEKYRLLIQKVQAAIVLHDGQGCILDSNPLARHLLGLSEDQLLGKALIDPDWHFLREDGSVLPITEYPVSLVLSTQKPLGGYVAGIHHPGRDEITWVLINAEPEYGDTGEITQVLVSFVDITERRRAEIALRENEERLSISLEVSNAGIWEWNIETNEIFFDIRFHAMLGYLPGELPHTLEEWKNYHHPEEMPVMFSKTSAYLRGDSSVYESQHRIRNKSGTWSWIFTRGKLVNLAPTGSPKQFIGIAMDITSQKQAERQLTLVDFALNHVREAAFLIDENARFRYVNDEACRVLGYTQAELLGLGVSEIDPDFPLERWPNHWNDLKSQHSLIFEGCHRTKEGRIFPVEVSANYFEHDGRAYNLALVRDITERKRAAEALETERKRMEIVLSAQNTGLSLINPDMTIAWVNPKIREMFPGREPVGQVCHVFYESRETICEGCGTLQAFKEGKIVESEQPVPVTGRWYYIISQPIKDTAGRVVNVLEGITDITDRKKGEETLRQNLSELQRWHDVTLDREERVQELKAEVNQLLTQLGELPRYESQI